MKAGIHVTRFNFKKENIADALTDIAEAAEEANFSNLTVMDHYFQIPYVGKYTDPMLESYTTLSFIAAKTNTLRLGVLVTGVIYREPAFLIKQLTTLDVLSNGRAIFGIGAAWNEEESKALGFKFPVVSERFERLEEVLQIARQMFAGDNSPYHGKYYHLENPLLSPKPISKPYPQIIIGGGGELKTLRLVAKYADACNLFAMIGEEELKHKLEVLRKHCEDVGRSYDEIEKTVLLNVKVDDEPIDIINKCKNLEKLGFDLVLFSIGEMEAPDLIKRFGREVIDKI